MNNSENMKMAAMCWLRFQKQLSYVATECGHYSADVIGCDGEDLVEIEVKVSVSDMKADFRNKAEKHEWYPDPIGKAEKHNKDLKEKLQKEFPNHPKLVEQRYKWNCKEMDITSTWYPTHMYFLVTKEMAKEAVEFLETKNPKIGVMYYWNPGGMPFEGNIHIVKRAKLLRPKGVHVAIKNRLAHRMASEIIGAKQRIFRLMNKT